MLSLNIIRKKPAHLLLMVVALLMVGIISTASAANTPADSPNGIAQQSSYADLVAKAQQDGSVRVIVGLSTSFTPAGLSAAASLNQEAAIQQDRASLVNALPSQHVSVIQESLNWTIPYVAFSTDAAGLAALAANPLVVQIEEDVPSFHALDLSVPRINAPQVWTAGYTGSGITVAVLDTGTDRTHPAFAGRIVGEACFSSNNPGQGQNTSVSLCPNGQNSQTGVNTGVDCANSIGGCGHGTHVAGIVGGAASGAGNSNGVAPGANIMPIQVFAQFTQLPACLSNYGTLTCALTWNTDQISALTYVYNQRNNYNIAAANMSLGGGQEFGFCDTDSRKAIIDQLRGVGIATVIASGNSGFTGSMGRPACISSAISVGATTDDETIASYSNHATFLDLLAPGSSIMSTRNGGGTVQFNGTSMAAPHVAGAWALMKQANPGATVTQIEDAFKATGVPIARSGISKPRINILAAAQSLNPNFGQQGHRLALFNANTHQIARATSLTSNPTFTTSTANPPIAANANNQWVMGDWNGNGTQTPGVFAGGAFHKTNTANGVGGWGSHWIGPNGRAVAGKFNRYVANDCFGVIEQATMSGFDVFVLWYTCDFSTATPNVTWHWLSAPLPTTSGFTGTFQFASGDWTNDGSATVTVRRNENIAYSNVWVVNTGAPPPQNTNNTYAEFTGAQYWGAPSAIASNYLVGGNWDNVGGASFGVVYMNGTSGNFVYRNNTEWNNPVNGSQTFTSPIGTPTHIVSYKPAAGALVAGGEVESIDAPLSSLDAGAVELLPLESLDTGDLAPLD